jgi:hypothetical protein
MIQTINVSGLKPEQLEQIKSIIDAFNAKNKLEQLAIEQIDNPTPDIINALTENPIKVNGFLTREDIYDR